MVIAEKPIVTALAPWFGSKRTLAEKIVEELGDHNVYWEPFCGSMAVLIAKPPCVMESVNDLHGDLVNLARVIAHEKLGAKLYRRLRRTMMSDTLHVEAAERHKARGRLRDVTPDLDAAYDYFLCAWLGRNGVAGTESYNQGFCVRYTANGGHAATRFNSCIASIPSWRRRIANVNILCRDAFDIITRFDDQPRTSIYCDPPYLIKGAKYVHDFRPTIPESSCPLEQKYGDHARLAKLLWRFKKARVVVSYYDHPGLAELYPGWTKRHTPTTKALVAQAKRDQKAKVEAPEVLLINGPSYAAAASAGGLLF